MNLEFLDVVNIVLSVLPLSSTGFQHERIVRRSESDYNQWWVLYHS